MNEQIQELADQAWDDTKEKFGSFVDDGGEVDFTFLHAFTEKFAELIVRECGVALSPMLRDMVSRGQAFDLINKHFGVLR